MKKIKLLILFFCVICMTACGTKKEKNETSPQLGENEIYAYCVNADKTDLVGNVYYLTEEKELEDNVDEILQFLTEVKKTKESQSPIPEGVEYTKNEFKQHHGRLTVSFNVLYDAVDADSMLFFKACVVKTLLQIKNVESVTLALTDVESSNADSVTVNESFDQDSFAMSFGDANGYKQKGTIVLYFANESGEALKEYRKSIEISNNTSLARIVVDSLIEGPDADGYTATIPAKTTIKNISVKDGICYVDLSDEFYDIENPLKNDVIVYSIVNSLVELPTVSKVQFLKNGEKQSFFRETMPFDGIFERNLDLIEEDVKE